MQLDPSLINKDLVKEILKLINSEGNPMEIVTTLTHLLDFIIEKSARNPTAAALMRLLVAETVCNHVPFESQLTEMVTDPDLILAISGENKSFYDVISTCTLVISQIIAKGAPDTLASLSATHTVRHILLEIALKNTDEVTTVGTLN